MCSQGKTRRRSGRTRSTTPIRGSDRQRPLPRPTLRARSAVDAGQESTLLGTAQGLSPADRLPFRRSRPAGGVAAPWRCRHDRAWYPPQAGAAAREFRREPAVGITVVTGRSTAWQHLEFRVKRVGIPLKLRLVRRSPTGSTGKRSRGRSGTSISTGSAVQFLDSVVFRVNSRFYRPDWSLYRYRPAEAHRLLRRPVVGRAPTGSMHAPGSALRSAL